MNAIRVWLGASPKAKARRIFSWCFASLGAVLIPPFESFQQFGKNSRVNIPLDMRGKPFHDGFRTDASHGRQRSANPLHHRSKFGCDCAFLVFENGASYLIFIGTNRLNHLFPRWLVMRRELWTGNLTVRIGIGVALADETGHALGVSSGRIEVRNWNVLAVAAVT